jgi:F0F1-type ATP synthase assembly protein I
VEQAKEDKKDAAEKSKEMPKAGKERKEKELMSKDRFQEEFEKTETYKCSSFLGTLIGILVGGCIGIILFRILGLI